MSLYGSFSSLGIPDLFSILHQNGKTGLLSLVSRRDERGVLFFQGDLVYATACDSSRRLGNFLVGLGFLKAEELNRVEGEGDREDELLGQELLRRGSIKKEELFAAVRKQILDNLDEALLWEEGAFHFDEWNPSDFHDISTELTFRTRSILLESVRRFDESRLLRATFPDLSVVAEQVAPSPEGADASGLEAPECEILALVDGKRPLAQILRDSVFSPYETAVLLTALIRKGQVRTFPASSDGQRPHPDEETSMLPVTRDIAARLWWILDHKGASQRDLLVEEIGRDPLLVAKALRQLKVNRLFLPRGQLTIAGVLERLGDFRVRALVIPEVVRGFFFSREDYYWKACWEQSFRCARTCLNLARKVAYPHPEEVYLAGLLANLGIFILIGSHPDRYRVVLERALTSRLDLSKLEEAEFGNSHVAIGAHCAERWGFPEPLVSAIKYHHRTDEEPSPLLDLVALGNWASRTGESGIDFSENEERQIQGALKRFRLKRRKVLSLFEVAR